MDAGTLLNDLGITTKTLAVNAAGADVDLTTASSGKMAPFARRLFIGTGGVIAVKMIGDAAFTSYTVGNGQYLTGAFIAVGGSGSGTTASGIVAEQ